MAISNLHYCIEKWPFLLDLKIERKVVRFAFSRLVSAGVPTNVYIQCGIGHLAGDGARASLVARESLDVAVASLRGVFFRRNLKEIQPMQTKQAD